MYQTFLLFYIRLNQWSLQLIISYNRIHKTSGTCNNTVKNKHYVFQKCKYLQISNCCCFELLFLYYVLENIVICKTAEVPLQNNLDSSWLWMSVFYILDITNKIFSQIDIHTKNLQILLWQSQEVPKVMGSVYLHNLSDRQRIQAITHITKSEASLPNYFYTKDIKIWQIVVQIPQVSCYATYFNSFISHPR